MTLILLLRGLPPKLRGLPPKLRGLPPKLRGLPPKLRGLPPKMRGLPPKMQGDAAAAVGLMRCKENVAPKPKALCSWSAGLKINGGGGNMQMAKQLCSLLDYIYLVPSLF